jgi:ribonuclease HI
VRGVVHADGGARGNPAPAGIGVVLEDGRGRVLAEIAKPIGHATNNVAEYTALITGLELALGKGISDIEVYMDSELVVSQMKGEWKIKNERLRRLAVAAASLLGRFDSAKIVHVRRELNATADALANRAMDDAARAHDGGRAVEPSQSSLPE